jgi:capsular exopolysaccharide synthesis family protein
VLIDPRRSQVAEDQVTPPSNVVSEDSSLIESRVVLIQSTDVLKRVVEELKLTDDPEFGPHTSRLNSILGLLNFGPSAPRPSQASQDVSTAKTIEALQRRLKAKRKDLTSVIEVSVTSHDPEKAARIANAVTDSYINEQVQNKYDINKTAASWFNQRLDELKARGQALHDSLVQLQSNNSTNSQVRLRELVGEVDANRKLYEALLARYKQTAAQERLELSDSRVVARATIPIGPAFPKPLLTLAVAVFLGCLIGVLLALMVDYLDRRVKTMRQAEELTNVPALAAIPLVGTRELARRARRGRKALKKKYDPKDVGLLPPALQPPLMRTVLDEPTSLFAEAVRSVRLAVQRAARGESAKLVTVASSVDGEGKTTLAANLALSLAAIGMRTVLVDGDLRNPEMTRSLCPGAKVGLIDAATGHVPLEQAVLFDQPTGLVVIPSPPQHAALINEFAFTDAMSNFLQGLRRRFDFVIVDSPPLIPLVDGRGLAEQADRIVLALRWSATPQDVVSHAIETLGPTVDRVLGTVLTRVDLRQLRFYDYYRSSSYIEPYSHVRQPRAR